MVVAGPMSGNPFTGLSPSTTCCKPSISTTKDCPFSLQVLFGLQETLLIT